MKRLYWRPRKCSKWVILAIGLMSICGMSAVETLTTTPGGNFEREKRAAARLAQQSMELIKQERLRRGHPIDITIDPAGSGLIGIPISPVTSIAGHLGSKQTSINPNFAALLVELLTQAGVRPGDYVAVGCSGSFPCINLCLCAALETLQVKPVIIASAAASQYGANIPDLMWIDMERILNEQGLISFRSQAASVGGYEDRGVGMSHASRELICDAIQRNHLRLLDTESFTEAIDERLQIYEQQTRGAPIKAYVNVGGGAVSVGRALGKKLYAPGLNLVPPRGATDIDSVMTRFMKAGVPVIHMVEIPEIAAASSFPRAPTATPEVGCGSIYAQAGYNRYLAGGVLLLIVGSLRAFVLTGWGYRIVRLVRVQRLLEKHDPSPAKQAGMELMV